MGGGTFFIWLGLFKWSYHLVTRHFLLQKKEMSYHHVMNVCGAIVSIIQSIISSVCGVIIVVSCRHDIMGAVHSLSTWYAWVMGSYLLYDTFAMYQVHLSSLQQVPSSIVARIRSYVTRRPLIVAHHIFVALVHCPVIIYRNGIGDFFIGCFYCAEFSGPFTNMRVILSRIGLKDSRWYVWNGIAMIVSFTMCRVLLCPYMYVTYGNKYGLTVFGVMKRLPYYCNLGSLILVLPQIHWLRLMILGALKIRKGKGLSEDEEKID